MQVVEFEGVDALIMRHVFLLRVMHVTRIIVSRAWGNTPLASGFSHEYPMSNISKQIFKVPTRVTCIDNDDIILYACAIR